jgi:hypothetical protein
MYYRRTQDNLHTACDAHVPGMSPVLKNPNSGAFLSEYSTPTWVVESSIAVLETLQRDHIG